MSDIYNDPDDKAHTVVNHADDDVYDEAWDVEQALELRAKEAALAALGDVEKLGHELGSELMKDAIAIEHLGSSLVKNVGGMLGKVAHGEMPLQIGHAHGHKKAGGDDESTLSGMTTVMSKKEKKKEKKRKKKEKEKKKAEVLALRLERRKAKEEKDKLKEGYVPVPDPGEYYNSERSEDA